DYSSRVATRPTLREELCDSCFVLRRSRAAENLLKSPPPLSRPPQRLLAIFIKSPVAAWPRRRLPPSPGRTHLVHRSIPTSRAPVFRGSHSSAPHNECQGGKTKRPPDEEAEDHERNPGWFSQLIELCYDRHSGLAL